MKINRIVLNIIERKEIYDKIISNLDLDHNDSFFLLNLENDQIWINYLDRFLITKAINVVSVFLEHLKIYISGR